MKKLWLIIWHRPFVTCPFCKGRGGDVVGYYEPEWTECRECWDYWKDLDDWGLAWFAGRLPLLKFIQARASIWCGPPWPASLDERGRSRAGITNVAVRLHQKPAASGGE